MEGKNQELRHALVKAMVEFRRVKPTIQMVCGLPAGEFFFLQRIHELANEGEVRVSSLRDAMSMTMPFAVTRGFVPCANSRFYK